MYVFLYFQKKTQIFVIFLGIGHKLTDKDVSSLLEVGAEIWGGSYDNIIVFDEKVVAISKLIPNLYSNNQLKSIQVIHQISLKSVPFSSQARKLPLVSVGFNHIWVGSGSDIHVFSAKVCFWSDYLFYYYLITFPFRHERKSHLLFSMFTLLHAC